MCAWVCICMYLIWDSLCFGIFRLVFFFFFFNQIWDISTLILKLFYGLFSFPLLLNFFLLRYLIILCYCKFLKFFISNCLLLVFREIIDFVFILLLLLLSCFSRVRLCATPWTAAHQAPWFTGFSRQEYWSGLPFPSPTPSC